MYVTDEINLPFHPLNTTLKQTIASCPLQIITYNKDKGETFSTMNAIQILEGNESDPIGLPERFKLIEPLDKNR